MSIVSDMERVNSELITQTSLITQIETALEGKTTGSGTSGSSASTIFKTSTTLSSNNTSITFSGLSKQPIAFFVIAGTQITLSTTKCITSVSFDGSIIRAVYSNSTYATATSSGVSNNYFSSTFSNGTLTVSTSSSTSSYFKYGCTYYLVAIL